MKTKLLLSMMLLAVLGVQAQQATIQITREDFPQIGSTYYYMKQFSSLAQPGGDTGRAANWNFSSYAGTTSRDSLWVVARSNWNGIDSFPLSDVVLTTTEKIQFLATTGNGYNLLGEWDSIPLSYKTPLTYAVFPITLGSAWSSRTTSVVAKAISGTIIGNTNTSNNSNSSSNSNGNTNGQGSGQDYDSTRVTTTVSLSDTADAAGTIKTPVGTYQAIRVKSLKRYNIIYEARITTGQVGWSPYQPSGTTPPADTVEYKWWAKGIGSEVYKVKFAQNSPGQTTSTSNNNTTSTTATNTTAQSSWFVSKSSVTATSNALPQSAFILAPNPNDGTFVLTGTTGQASGYDINITDLPGREVYAGRIQDLSKNIELTGCAQGIYCMKITDPTGKFLIKRFVVVK